VGDLLVDGLLASRLVSGLLVGGLSIVSLPTAASDEGCGLQGGVDA
jgi:hypothetical protein